jgi:hypothetical protein
MIITEQFLRDMGACEDGIQAAIEAGCMGLQYAEAYALFEAYVLALEGARKVQAHPWLQWSAKLPERPKAIRDGQQLVQEDVILDAEDVPLVKMFRIARVQNGVARTLSTDAQIEETGTYLINNRQVGRNVTLEGRDAVLNYCQQPANQRQGPKFLRVLHDVEGYTAEEFATE